jgi:hypothetical protein
MEAATTRGGSQGRYTLSSLHRAVIDKRKCPSKRVFFHIFSIVVLQDFIFFGVLELVLGCFGCSPAASLSSDRVSVLAGAILCMLICELVIADDIPVVGADLAVPFECFGL